MSNPFRFLFELRALWFILFYISLALVFAYKDRYPLRKLFLVAFFSFLVIISLVGTQFLPFMAWHKFPTTYPQTETSYELRVVTDDDRELPYDIRATLGVEGVYDPYLTTDMAEEYSYCKNIQIMQYLLQRAHAYRSEVEQRSILTFARFPPHALDDMWTKKELKDYGEFTGVRLYEREVRSSADGTEIQSMSEEMIIEYVESAEYECSPDTISGVS